MDRRLLGHFNWSILLVVLAIDAIGIVNLNSAVHQEGASTLAPTFVSQIAFMIGGIILMSMATLLDYRVYERLAYPLYGVGLILLASVLIFGREVSGSKRWLDLGLFRLQPAELTKLLFVMAIAKYFHDDGRAGEYQLRALVPPLLIAAPAVVLIFLSPDLGTTGFYLFLFGMIALAVGLHWRSALLALVVALFALPLAYEFLLTDYQRERVVTLLDPHHDPRGKGYQILQARYAIGAGRLFGNGYMKGMQTHQGFIPENHTDFIITVMAEEWGFMGCLVLLSLYFVLIMLGLGVAAQSKERFGTLLATGIVSIIFLQVTINLSAVLGLIPVTGVTLPLVSYGGSSVLTIHIAIGLLLNISMRRYMF